MGLTLWKYGWLTEMGKYMIMVFGDKVDIFTKTVGFTFTLMADRDRPGRVECFAWDGNCYR